MRDFWLLPDRVFDGGNLRQGVALRLTGGTVTAISTQPPAAPRRIPGTVSPGFVDLQVNGGGGVMLNSTPTLAGMQAMATAHASLGTVAILPTVITDAPEVLEAAADAAIAARQHNTPHLLGLHIEGPHIDPVRRGTHAARFIRALDDATMTILRRLRAADVAVLITLAPEAATPDQIRTLGTLGVIVSLGHSNCTAGAARAAIAAGATCATHLYNAMSPLGHREPGLVGAVLNSTLDSGIICDGIHVADEMVGLAIRARPEPDRMFLVSDAMATVGGPDHFDLYGQRITLRDGRLVNAEGSLAGAHVTQAQGLERLVRHVGIGPETALRMVVSTPARVIGAAHLAAITGRRASDLVVLGDGLVWQGSLADHLAGDRSSST